VQLGQMQHTAGLFDVAEYSAGTDRGELLIITDQPDTRASIDSELHGPIESEGVGHPRFIDDQQRRRADRAGSWKCGCDVLADSLVALLGCTAPW